MGHTFTRDSTRTTLAWHIPTIDLSSILYVPLIRTSHMGLSPTDASLIGLSFPAAYLMDVYLTG
jgi:hypothetical protein